MSFFSNTDLELFSKLYTKHYGVVLSASEAQLKLQALVQLLQVARESRSQSLVTVPIITVTGKPNNPTNHD